MKRFIIGGASDNLKNIPKALYKTGTVIGVNDWLLHDPCDIWLGCDGGVATRLYQAQIAQALKLTKMSVYAGRMVARVLHARFNKAVRTRLHVFYRDPGHYKLTPEQVKRPYNGKLLWLGTSSLAAVHLAICMNATEIVLAGFDCYGNKRWNDYTYTAQDLNFKPVQIARGDHKEGWTKTAPFINRLMSKFNRVPGVKIWKTLKESPLDCDYLDPTSDHALNPKAS